MLKIPLLLLSLMLSVNIYAQNQREIIPTIGINIDTNTFPVGLQFRNQIKDHFWIAPDIGIAYGSPDKSVIVNMNANLHYVIFFSPDTDFSSFYPLIGGSWHNYKTINTDNSFYDLETGSAVLCNIGFGTDMDINKSQFLRAEFKYSFGDGRNYYNIFLGWGFCF